MNTDPNNGFPEEKKYAGLKRSRFAAFAVTLIFGPFGFWIYMGFKAFLISLVWYIGISVLSAGAGIPIVVIGGAIVAAFGIQLQAKTPEYIEYEKKLKGDRKNREKEYCENLGQGKLKTIFFGDPNKKKGFVSAGKSLVKAIQGDTSELKKAGKHLMSALDPVDNPCNEGDKSSEDQKDNNRKQNSN